MKLILCAALALMTGSAGAAVNKCVDADGRVLFTDAECPHTQEQDVSLETAGATPAAAPTLAPMLTPAPRSRWASLPRPAARRATSIDVATLQAARQSMQLGTSRRRSAGS